MVSNESVHADLHLSCGAKLRDDDGDVLTRTTDLPDNHPDAPGTHEQPHFCGTQMVGRDHATFVQTPRGKDRHGNLLRDRFQQDALRFTCPDCGADSWVCPVCSGDGAPGWFRGDSTGDLLPCHNCNMEEVQRQRRDPHSGVSY